MRRRVMLSALALLAAFAAGARAAAPAPSAITPDLVAAAQKEGKIVFYTALDLRVAEKLGKAFEAAFPGVTAEINRSGAERIYQRIAEEYGAGIHAVDAVDSTNISHLIDWKRRGMLGAYVPQDVARWPKEQRDPDGTYATSRADLLVLGYNTRLIAPPDAPKSFAELVDAKWNSKIVKAHPAYAGSVMTATFLLSRMLGWSYFEKLGQLHVMQVQSSTEPPKKLALGERPVMFDGQEYVALSEIKAGAPIAIVYPAEGTPLVPGSAAIMQAAPHPNAARLFIGFLFSRAGQQLLVDEGAVRSFHPDMQEPSRTPLARIKTLTADPVELEKSIEEIKHKYAAYFGT